MTTAPVSAEHAALICMIRHPREHGWHHWDSYARALTEMPRKDMFLRCTLLAFLERRFGETRFYDAVLEVAVLMTLYDNEVVAVAADAVSNAPCWESHLGRTWATMKAAFNDTPESRTVTLVRLRALARGLAYPSNTEWDELGSVLRDGTLGLELVEALFGAREVAR